MPEKATVAAVVCAYNEQDYLGEVLSSLNEAQRAHKIDQVLVIDDGSTDKTAEIARRFGARVIRLKRNCGKAYSFFAAVRSLARQKHPPTYMISLDADLQKFSPEQIDVLLYPLRTNKRVHMSVGEVKTNSVTGLSGQRAFDFRLLRRAFLGLGGKGNRVLFDALSFKPVRRIGAPPKERLQLLRVRGYGLENILSEIFSNHYDFVPTSFMEARRHFLGPGARYLPPSLKKTVDWCLQRRARKRPNHPS